MSERCTHELNIGEQHQPFMNPRAAAEPERTGNEHGERKQIEEIEHDIESMEAVVEGIEQQFTLLGANDYVRARSLKEEYDGLKKDLETMYAEWERLVSEPVEEP